MNDGNFNRFEAAGERETKPPVVKLVGADGNAFNVIGLVPPGRAEGRLEPGAHRRSDRGDDQRRLRQRPRHGDEVLRRALIVNRVNTEV